MKQDTWAHNIPPSEHNIFLIDAIDIIIDRIAENLTFPKMLAQLTTHRIDFTKDWVVLDSPSFNGHFKDWLEHNFVSIFRSNTCGAVPPIIIWRLGFGLLTFRVSKKAALDLLMEDVDYWGANLKKSHYPAFPYKFSCPLFYDLAEERFVNYV